MTHHCDIKIGQLVKVVCVSGFCIIMKVLFSLSKLDSLAVSTKSSLLPPRGDVWSYIIWQFWGEISVGSDRHISFVSSPPFI